MSSPDLGIYMHAGSVPVYSEKFKDEGYESCCHYHWRMWPTTSLFYNSEYGHQGLLAAYAKETTGLKHRVESIPNALSSIKNEQLPKWKEQSVGMAKPRNDRQELGHFPS